MIEKIRRHKAIARATAQTKVSMQQSRQFVNKEQNVLKTITIHLQKKGFTFVNEKNNESFSYKMLMENDVQMQQVSKFTVCIDVPFWK